MRRRKLLLIVVPVLSLACAVAAWAYWTTAGAGAASASVGTLTAPGTPSAAVQIGGTVNLSWSASTVSGGGTVRYHVERRPSAGSTWSDACASTDAQPIAATSCSDTPGDGTFVYRVTARFNSWRTAGGESSAVTVVTDNTPPYVVAINRIGTQATNANSAQWTVSFSEAVTGVDASDFTLASTGLGGTPSITSVAAANSATFTVTASTGTGSGTLGLNLVDDNSITDGAAHPLADGSGGADGSFTGQTYLVDRANPSNALSLAVFTGGAYLSGTTLYYKSGAAGSFTLTNAVADTGGAGAASSSFPAVSSGGMTHAGDTVTTPSGGPYVSSPYSWTSSTFAGTHAITAADAAGNTATTTLTFAVDNAAPTGGALGTSGVNGGYNTSGSFTVTRTDYTDTGGSGIASSVLVRDEAPLSGNACGSFGNQVTISGTPPTQNAAAGIATGKCYRYTLTGTDNVGNTASTSVTVKVDAANPTNGLSLNVIAGRAYLGGTTLYYRTDVAGSLTITDTVSDSTSGPASAFFPAIATGGWSHTSQTVSTPTGGPYSSSAYTWTAAATFSGPHAITSTDVAGNTGTTNLGFAVDNAGPTGGALTVNGTAASSAGTLSFDKNGSFTIGTRTDFTDSGSGIASATLVRDQAPLSNNTCGTFGSAATLTGAPVQDASAGISSGNCYRYTLSATDNLGNAATSISSTVKFDSVAQTTTDNTASFGNAWRNTSTTITLTPTDTGGSNVATTYYTTDGSTPTTSSTTGTSIALTTTGVYTIKYFSVDNAGNQESVKTASSQIRIDKTLPTNAFSLGGSPVGAFLSGGTLYFKSNAAGSFSLVNTVTDAHSGPASATFPSVTATGWTHPAETVSTSSGGPFASAYSWSSGAAAPSAASLTSTDVAGNTSSASTLTFVSDTAAPTAGALSVNGTAATGAGSTSVATTTSFAIDSRTDYTDAGSGIASSVLTIRSATLTGSTCGAAGSGGPYTSATTISGTTNPAITKGFCYVYTLTGTDNVGNTASVATTVKAMPNYTFVVSNPGARTAGTAFGGVTLQLQADGVNTTSYNGVAYSGAKTITFSGPASSPAGIAPAYPSSVTFTNGTATVSGITLTKAETTTLTATDATVTPSVAGTSGSFTVSAGSATHLAWTHITTTSATAAPATCLFTCSYAAFGNNANFTANVSVTDDYGNTVSNVGNGHTVSVTRGGDGGAFTAPTSGNPVSLTIAATGPADSTQTFTFRSQGGSWTSDSLTAQTTAGTAYTNASATLLKT